MPYDYQSMITSANDQYQQTISGYQTALSGMQSQQQAISQGYNTLQASVLGKIEGTDAAQRQAIRDEYAMQSGKMQQSMINRGLGNTTVQGAMQRGLTLDESKAETDLSNKFAQTAAQYQSQLGLAGLGYRGNALKDQQALQQAQLGYMGQWGMKQADLALGYAGLNEQEQARLMRGYGGGGGGGGGGSKSSGAYPGAYGSHPVYSTGNAYSDWTSGDWDALRSQQQGIRAAERMTPWQYPAAMPNMLGDNYPIHLDTYSDSGLSNYDWGASYE